MTMNKPLFRPRNQRVFGGVCVAIANFFQLDPFFIRLIFVLLAVGTFFMPLLLCYLGAMIFIPLQPVDENSHLDRVWLYRAVADKRIAGLCGGFADICNCSATTLRLLALMLLIYSGFFPVALMYILGWLTIPVKS